ncbi:MAG TPA: peptidylprolyl isomerase [Candidatus Eisenbacteria bacterium]|nr:peptidylprolyl isomerase [Candidatus Eisenbacteria bacterium]
MTRDLARLSLRTVTCLAALAIVAGCGGSKTTTTTTDTTATASGSAAVTDNSASAPPSGATGGASQPDAVSGAAPGTMPVRPDVTPAHIEVQHILIGFAGSVPGKGITRSQEEARALAHEILAKARGGENFDQLVSQHTDDSPPGIYRMSNTGVSAAEGEFPRERMVPAFGNVGFNLSPGNIDIAEYDPSASPYGYHVIKRLR